jgi:hypothetical protein
MNFTIFNKSKQEEALNGTMLDNFLRMWTQAAQDDIYV